ncbi:hypothetical protein [Marinomonas posidonica]|uniref:Uncharacterized protein n=1 Tax=Marinomonas posidonica (strain CECT 7376 / NCIMB 14433 / IVIA-Po-181) TaxID=491952 RepID=F6CYI3_MARPP|nr:hypothetical protein [Marinomonas posidonica]AEF54592.1 hypothetical protein Mar181_1551 [Marinomonas posidonica IVIA-Po-181]
MENLNLLELLEAIEHITLNDISQLPEDCQHLIVEYIEQLQDQLKPLQLKPKIQLQ